MISVPQTRWARTIDGACIAYQDIGEGPVTLVVIHGWVSHLEVYWEQPPYVRFIRRLSRNLRVLLFDKRGIGMSDRVQGTPDLGILLEDVRAVMDAAGVQKAALLGWGGPGPELAAFFAATYPERSVCLSLFGTIHAWQQPDYPWGDGPQEFEDDLARELRSWGSAAGAVDFVRGGYGDEPTACFFATNDRDSEDLARMQARLIPAARAVPVATTCEVIWAPEPEPMVAAVEGFIASVRQEEAELDRMLATVLFTDVVGSTDRACELGDHDWSELLERHHQTVRALIARYRSQAVSTTGDGVLATFDGPARAVRCAQGVCEAVRPLGLEVRAGCHTGEVELLGADFGGIAVHIGARVGALAGPSEVLVSSTVKDLVAGSGLVFSDRGEHELKGVPGSWHLYSADT